MSGRERRLMKRALYGSDRLKGHEFDHDGFAALSVFAGCLAYAICREWNPIVTGVTLAALMLGLQVVVNIRTVHQRRARAREASGRAPGSGLENNWWMLAGFFDDHHNVD